MKLNNLFISLRKLALPFFVMLVYLFLYIPIIVLVMFSFNESASGYAWTGFTFDWYHKLFQSKEIWIAFINSMIVATSAVVLSVTMGVLIVWGLSDRFYYLISMFYSTMMIPDIVIAVGLLVFFDFLSIPLGLTTLIVGHTLLGLGFVVPTIYSRFLELDYQTVEASLDLGATEWQTFMRVILPFLTPAIISSALSVFILSFDDFLVSFFCSGSSSQTLSLYIFAMIRAGLSPVINALSTLILISSIILVAFFSLVKINPERPKYD